MAVLLEELHCALEEAEHALGSLALLLALAVDEVVEDVFDIFFAEGGLGFEHTEVDFGFVRVG